MNRRAIVVITATTCTLGAFAWAGWAQRTKEQNHRAFRAAIEAPKRSDVSNAQHVEQIWAAAEKVEGAEPKREAARVGLEIAYQAASSEGPGEAGAILESVSQRIEADSSLTEDTQAQAIREQADYQAAVAAQMGGDKAREWEAIRRAPSSCSRVSFRNIRRLPLSTVFIDVCMTWQIQTKSARPWISSGKRSTKSNKRGLPSGWPSVARAPFIAG